MILPSRPASGSEMQCMSRQLSLPSTLETSKSRSLSLQSASPNFLESSVYCSIKTPPGREDSAALFMACGAARFISETPLPAGRGVDMDYITKGIEECLEGKEGKLRYPFMFVAGHLDYLLGTADEMRAHNATLDVDGSEKDPRATEKDYNLYLGGRVSATFGEGFLYFMSSMLGLKYEAYVLLGDLLTRAVNSKRTKQPVGLIGTGRNIVHRVRKKLEKQAEDLEVAVEQSEE